MLEFIDLYRQLPELWKVKSDGKNRHLKNLDYERLVQKLKKIELENVNREIAKN